MGGGGKKEVESRAYSQKSCEKGEGRMKVKESSRGCWEECLVRQRWRKRAEKVERTTRVRKEMGKEIVKNMGSDRK